MEKLNKNSIKKKISFVTDNFYPCIGGIEKWVNSLSLLLSRYFDIKIISIKKNLFINQTNINSFSNGLNNLYEGIYNNVCIIKPSFTGNLFLSAFFIWHFPFVRRFAPHFVYDFLYIFFNLAYSNKLEKVIKDSNLVHCFSTGYLAVCVTRICKKYKIPLIHSPAVHFGRWGDTSLLLKSYAKADALIAISSYLKSNLENKLPNTQSPIYVCPPLLAPKSKPQAPRQEIVKPFILFLGRKEERKGFFDLISAFKNIKSNATLVIAGLGQSVIELDNRIIDLGTIDDNLKQWLLDNCDIFCLPSKDETFGIVYLEAMRSGKVVVAFDIPPVNEICLNEITSLLVPVNNISALSQALEKLLCNEELRLKLGNNAKRRYEEFYSNDKLVNNVIKIYDKLLIKN